MGIGIWTIFIESQRPPKTLRLDRERCVLSAIIKNVDFSVIHVPTQKK